MWLIFWVNKSVGECGSFLSSPSKSWQGFCYLPPFDYHLLYCSFLFLPKKVDDDLLDSVLHDSGVSVRIVEVTDCIFWWGISAASSFQWCSLLLHLVT
jgi:hypothetical protein